VTLVRMTRAEIESQNETSFLLLCIVGLSTYVCTVYRMDILVHMTVMSFLAVSHATSFSFSFTVR
jgi:hypothetical protein